MKDGCVYSFACFNDAQTDMDVASFIYTKKMCRMPVMNNSSLSLSLIVVSSMMIAACGDHDEPTNQRPSQ
jgi:hypothetical protein